jgi:hypothetical protein
VIKFSEPIGRNFAILVTNVPSQRDRDMGLPRRLHGDTVLVHLGIVKDFCPKCTSNREWEIVKDENGKHFKRCKKKDCGFKKALKEDELKKLEQEAKLKAPPASPAKKGEEEKK